VAPDHRQYFENSLAARACGPAWARFLLTPAAARIGLLFLETAWGLCQRVRGTLKRIGLEAAAICARTAPQRSPSIAREAAFHAATYTAFAEGQKASMERKLVAGTALPPLTRLN
jgi:hypothetical protein